MEFEEIFRLVRRRINYLMLRILLFVNLFQTGFWKIKKSKSNLKSRQDNNHRQTIFKAAVERCISINQKAQYQPFLQMPKVTKMSKIKVFYLFKNYPVFLAILDALPPGRRPYTPV
jgi:hypothetical protein